MEKKQLQTKHNKYLPQFKPEEITRLSSDSKFNKFNSKGVELIYPKTVIDKIKYFEKCFRLIEYLYNSYSSNPEQEEENINLSEFGENPSEDMTTKSKVDFYEISKKLKVILDNYRDDYKYIHYYIVEYENNVNWGKNKIIRKMHDFYIKNMEKLNCLIDFVYPLGHVRKQINPDEHIGYF